MWRASRLPFVMLRRKRLQRQVALVLEDARRVADEETRMAIYRQAEMILFEETTVVPL